MGRARSWQGTAAFINLSLCMPLPVREKGLKLSPCSAFMVIGAAVHRAGAQAETLHCTPQPGCQLPTHPPSPSPESLAHCGTPFSGHFLSDLACPCVPGITRGYEVDFKRERGMHVPGMDTVSSPGASTTDTMPHMRHSSKSDLGTSLLKPACFY